MRALVRALWPFALLFGLTVLWWTAMDAAAAISDAADRKRRSRELLEYQAEQAYRYMRARENRADTTRAVARIVGLGFALPVFGTFAIVWAFYGILSAITGEPVRW